MNKLKELMKPPIKDPRSCYWYFRNVRMERWEEAENVIFSDRNCATYYIFFIYNCQSKKEIEELQSKAKRIIHNVQTMNT